MSVVLNPLDPAFLRDPYPTYAALRAEAPIHRHPGGFYAVSRYDDVVRVLRDPETFSSAAMGGPVAVDPGGPIASPTAGSLIGQDPPVHTGQRNVVSRAFTPRRIAALEPRIRALCDAYVDRFADRAERGRVDLMAELANPLPVAVIAELLGLPAERLDDFKRWSTALIIGSTQLGAMRRRAANQALIREFQQFMAETVARRRRAPGDDLVSVLIHAGEDEDVLEPQQVVAFAALLLAAGSETTTNLIGNAVVALLRHPEALERVRADPGRVPAVLEETLRWDSPVQILARLSTRDAELPSGKIPRGVFVMLLLASANRDDARFPRAERFDPDREARGHLAFGLGNHFCLGAALARLEGRVALEAILARLPGLALDTDRLEPHGSFLVRGPAALPVRFDA